MNGRELMRACSIVQGKKIGEDNLRREWWPEPAGLTLNDL